ncbi:uncharacterized protein LOC125670065 [Ostrea edulis]|uniref:uncharacterized protein LOC125670065 n=1 Tax=Ostrea edulis TaxID=37623 RepID=UPI0024AEC776|nr:uncharacterized protein LOC125670065 [Ostrea edulis]
MEAWSELLLTFLFVRSVYSMKQLEGPTQCVIIQDKQQYMLPKVPDFLINTAAAAAACQIRKQERNALQCGHSGVYIKPECICTVLNVLEAKYHNRTACPKAGEKSDSVPKLKCSDCKKHSVDNKGPCINGGNLTCTKDVLAPEIACNCPKGYSGMFCESKMLQVVRICDRITQNLDLRSCDITKMDCITYSENRIYTFKCNETNSDQILKRGDLPLCSETEIIVKVLDTTTEIASRQNMTGDLRSGSVTSGAGSCTASLSILFIMVKSLFVLVER